MTNSLAVGISTWGYVQVISGCCSILTPSNKGQTSVILSIDVPRNIHQKPEDDYGEERGEKSVAQMVRLGFEVSTCII